MEEEETNAFIVLSDTHLGLRAGKRLYFFENTVDHRPIHVDQFLKWLQVLQDEGEKEIPVAMEQSNNGEYKINAISLKKLMLPDKLVLNGDIFELWDTSDQSIQFASYSIFSSLAKLSCDKYYTIGNHDFANAELAVGEEGKNKIYSNIYPWGLSNLNIVRDTFPVPKEGTIRTLKVGEYHYLIVHGHQFNKSFRIAPWKIISTLRDGAETFRLYSWVLLGLWIVWLASIPFTYLLGLDVSTSSQYVM
jgi:hypothetical protein